MANSIAIVLGGAECVMAEFELAKKLCDEAGAPYTVFAINDQIAAYSGECIAVTLHPDKLPSWLVQRANEKFPIPFERWSNRPAKQVTHTTRDLGGSSGFFAPKIAKEKQMRSILCGVPMLVEAKHFVRHKPWHAVGHFRKAWTAHKTEFMPWIRSWSGWSSEIYGKPDLEFINGR